MSPHKKRMPVISLTIFFLILLSTGLSGYYVWQGFLYGFDKYLPVLASCLLMDGLGVFALVFKVSFENRRRAMVPFVTSLLLLAVCAIHLAALANARIGAISQDETDARQKRQDDDRHARNVNDARELVELNCAECSPERKRRMYQSEMARLEKASSGDQTKKGTGALFGREQAERSWGRRYVEDYATAVQLIFGLLAGLAMLINAFLRMYADEPVEKNTNAFGEISTAQEEFPGFLEVENRLPMRRGKFTQKKETAKKHASFDPAGLAALRDTLRDISFRLRGLSFKSYVRGDAVWVLMMKANQGTQETVASAKAKLSLLDDAMRMERTAFRERLERFLRENGFEI